MDTATKTRIREGRESRTAKGQALYETGAVSLREMETRPRPDTSTYTGVLEIASAVYEVEGSAGKTYRVEYLADRGRAAFRCNCSDRPPRADVECKHTVAAGLDQKTRARQLFAATAIEQEGAGDHGFDL